MDRQSFEMPVVCGFIFQDQPISSAVQTVLLANTRNIRRIRAESIITSKLERLLVSAVSHLELWKEEKDTGPFLKAISQEFGIASSVVLEILNFAISARIRFWDHMNIMYGEWSYRAGEVSSCLEYCADRIGCQNMCMRSHPRLEDWLKDRHKIPAPAPAAGGSNDGVRGGGRDGKARGTDRSGNGKCVDLTQEDEIGIFITTTRDKATQWEQERRLEALAGIVCQDRSTPPWEEG
ncbi:hypothetical protein F4859DRAFT_516513 [Xylaria cf. heliscus]|nr:hypothetical protein F4859DRAFT_516513 [Xylaria cf. heliscus]